MKRSLARRELLVVSTLLMLVGSATPAWAELRLRDICRVKGQEENSLQGLGLVVGLKGTGDGDARPTSRALATMMKLMGNPLPPGPNNEALLAELKNAKNVALVFVTATVPAAGARQGDQLNCTVSAISAKSLDGGVLMSTPLLGPRPGSDRVYAVAQGALHLETPTQMNVAKIYQGCRLEADFHNVFIKEGFITLVLDENHAGFQTAQEVADLINTQSSFLGGDDRGRVLARAMDQVNIEIYIPSHYADDPVLFVSQILTQRIINPQTDARVVINERAGSVVIGADVEIGAVVVTHRNIVIEAAATPFDASRFIPIDPNETSTTKLKTLVDALNAVKVPTSDIIDIIKSLKRNGKLYGKLIIE